MATTTRGTQPGRAGESTLLVEETGSDALLAFLARAVEGGDVVGSSRLLETAPRR